MKKNLVVTVDQELGYIVSVDASIPVKEVK